MSPHLSYNQAPIAVIRQGNVLINAQHGAAGAIVATNLRRWIYDPRFLP